MTFVWLYHLHEKTRVKTAPEMLLQKGGIEEGNLTLAALDIGQNDQGNWWIFR